MQLQAAHLVHLPLLPLRDGAAGGGRGARQGAAPCHDLVHLQDTLLSADSAHPSPSSCPRSYVLALAGEIAVHSFRFVVSWFILVLWDLRLIFPQIW